MIDFNQFPSPCYIMEEELLRKNLCLIKNVADSDSQQKEEQSDQCVCDSKF